MRFRPFIPVDRGSSRSAKRGRAAADSSAGAARCPRRIKLSLHTRVGLVLTLFGASLLVVLAGVWLQGTRNAIHEEVEAATRVSAQWLRVVLGEMDDGPPATRGERLLGVARAIGRVRANELEIRTAGGETIYRSPAPTYKAGRSAPAWFAGLLASEQPAPSLAMEGYSMILHPDDSRAVLDAWDDLAAMAGWAIAFLCAIFLATRRALGRALDPLKQIMHALERTGRGRFDTRLPVFATPELGRLSRAFNGMADRLGAAVDQNVRLESAREVDRCLHARLEAERRIIARELHDELAQGITAVRALAGAIVQRTADAPSLHVPAQGIVAVTGEMQDGVRNILHRLRPAAGNSLAVTLERQIAGWQGQHPEIVVNSSLLIGPQPVADDLAMAVVRIVQEGLTNVVRHADATQVDLAITRVAGWLQVSLADNGRGRSAQPSAQAGCGLGLAGMGERIAALGGHLQFEQPAGGGFRIVACLPDALTQHCPEEFA